MTIHIDSREDHLLENELKLLGIPTERNMLDIGDYVFWDIGIERKTSEDFYKSIADRRIWEQAFNLKNNFGRPILLMTGVVPETMIIQKRAVRVRNGMLGAIASLYMNGIPVLMPVTEKNAAYIIAQMYFKCEKKGDSLKPVEKKKIRISDIREDILSRIPRIGRVKAEKILEQFKTIDQMIHAEEENLNKVQKDLGENVRKIFLEDKEEES